ncbi:hypothetical protein V496_10521 [Pseudogymnoascus sp. VKM F-4515 (FW-2607)]|nr:hypothetical protein V496_10521 [Pseudogymnoascus sp. VKM F-4515 (FW-2607)]
MASNSAPPQWQKGDLWDTDPNTFVAREAIKRLDLTQCYLTDDAIMKLLINKRERTITAINIFRFNEIEFVKNGFLRSRHRGRGAPALAPDGTVMAVMAGAHHGSTIVLNGGNSSLPAGSWSIENYQAKSDHPGYEQWLSKINPPKRAQQNISEPEKNKDDLREKKANSPDLKTEDLADEVQANNAENTANKGQDRIAASRSEMPQEAPVEETPSEYTTLSSTYSVITTSKPTTPEPSRPEAGGSHVAGFERAASEPGTPKAATPEPSRREVDGSQVAATDRAASEPATSKAVAPEPVIAEFGASEPVIAHPITPDREPDTPDPPIPEPVALETVILQPATPDRAVFESETPEAMISEATTTDITAFEPTASEHSKAAGSGAPDLGVERSEVVGSEAVGWRVARSEATGSETTGSKVVAATSELANSEPIISGPTVSEVAVSHPVAPKPVSSEPPASEFTVMEPIFLEEAASEDAPTEPTPVSEALNPVTSKVAILEPVASNPAASVSEAITPVTSEVAGLETVALKPAASEPTPEPASKPAPLKSFASISMQAKINSPEHLLPTSTPRNINTFLFQPEAQGPMNSSMMQSQPPASVRQQAPSPGPTLIWARPESTVGLGINTGLMQQRVPKTPASVFRHYTPRQPSLEIAESPPSPARPTLRSEAQLPRGSNAAMPAARHNLRHSTTTQSGSVTKVTVSSFQTPPPTTPSSTGSLKRKATEPFDRVVTFFVTDDKLVYTDDKSVYTGCFNFSERKWAENAPGFYEMFKGAGRRVKNMNGLVYDIVENPKLFEAMLFWIDKRKVMQMSYFAPYNLESYYLELYLAAVNYALPGLSNAVIDELHEWHSRDTIKLQMIDKVYEVTQPGDGLRRFYFSCMMALSIEEFEATSIEETEVMVDLFAVKKENWDGMKAKEAYQDV